MSFDVDEMNMWRREKGKCMRKIIWNFIDIENNVFGLVDCWLASFRHDELHIKINSNECKSKTINYRTTRLPMLLSIFSACYVKIFCVFAICQRQRTRISSTTQWLASRLSWNESIKITVQGKNSTRRFCSVCWFSISSSFTVVHIHSVCEGARKISIFDDDNINKRTLAPHLNYQHLMTRCSNFHFYFYYFFFPFSGSVFTFSQPPLLTFWLNHNLFSLIKFVCYSNVKKELFFSVLVMTTTNGEREKRRRRWYLADTKYKKCETRKREEKKYKIFGQNKNHFTFFLNNAIFFTFFIALERFLKVRARESAWLSSQV